MNGNSVCSPHPGFIFPIFICDHCGGRATVTNGIFIKSSVSRAHCAGLLSIKREIMTVTAGAGRGWSDQHNTRLTTALQPGSSCSDKPGLLNTIYPELRACFDFTLATGGAGAGWSWCQLVSLNKNKIFFSSAIPHLGSTDSILFKIVR